MRLPAYVNMEPTPYDPVLYRAGLEPVPANEDQNAKRSKMISVRNTIRWKWATGDDGEPVSLPLVGAGNGFVVRC
jgi:RNA polymerase-associated protein LEO1